MSSTPSSRFNPHFSRRNLMGIAALAVGGLGLASCSTSGMAGSGGASVDTENFDFTGKDTGAMAEYAVGDTFKASEPVKFGLFYRDHPNYPLKQDWLFLSTTKQNNNVEFDITTAPLSEWAQRRSLVIGAGDAPDIISVTYPGDEVPFVAGGAILPASDFAQFMPHYLDKVAKWKMEPDLQTLVQENGKYYVFPGFREKARAEYSFAVRKDVWEKLGLSLEPKTFDEFAEQLKKVKDANPGIVPMTDRWSANGPLESTLSMCAPNFGTSAGWGFGQGVTWDDAQKKLVYTGATNEYKSLITYFAGLIKDGLLDPESLTQDDDQAIQKFCSGKAFAISTNDQEILRYRTTFTELGNTTAEIVQIRVPAGPAGDRMASGGRLVSGFMISANAAKKPYFKAMLQYLDWLYYSDAGLEFAKWGVEGTTYTKAADGTRTLEADINTQGLNPAGTKDLQVDYGFCNGVWMLVHGSSVDLDRSMLRPEVKDFVASMDTKTVSEPLPPFPLNELDREQVSLYQSSLKDHVYQSTAAFILGQRPLTEWDAYVKELEGMNLSAYLDVVNAAQQKFAAQ
ncbi:extracellular solute-binding protein [Micrococcales bacterium 31B]|nr:extracellular solute-binding protein [Micrococcales bacterium 31B]